jgi:hypothetical protein
MELGYESRDASPRTLKIVSYLVVVVNKDKKWKSGGGVEPKDGWCRFRHAPYQRGW